MIYLQTAPHTVHRTERMYSKTAGKFRHFSPDIAIPAASKTDDQIAHICICTSHLQATDSNLPF
jgi:hypothetical protein